MVAYNKYIYMNTLLILIVLLLMSNCNKDKVLKDDELSIQKTSFTGNQLRIDGYYYNKWGNPERATIYFFTGMAFYLGVIRL